MVFIKLDELQKQLAEFFLHFGSDYFFVLSTKDYDPSAEKKLFCMCFNDDESHENSEANYLIEFLVKRKTDDGHSLALPDDRPGDCKYSDNTYRRIKNLTNHYLEHHPIKLCEFFKHVAFKNTDERMKKSASKTLVTWYEREQLRLYNAPRS
ncbi:uncharacterized protein LOC141850697 [Brevipalpus obovatus]|uniref:uncharacterized protein LOC141850697 n=1 Tax=Brevipalpus obovatus TaxID=246614 RepID=UPI003D9EE928